MRTSKVKNIEAFIKDLKELSIKEVSFKYGLGLTSIYKYKKRYGLNVYFSDNVPSDFIEYAKTHNKIQAKDHYGTSYATIRKWEWLANCKCSKHKGENKLKRNQKIRKMQFNHSYSEIGRMFGITKQRVEQIINRETDE